MADELDDERARGSLRGPLPGIPIVIKDAITTGLEMEMPTTLGSCAFESSLSRENAAVAQLLQDQGLLIIAKASLTEFCGVKGSNVTVGWSPLTGQAQSPYVVGGVIPDDLIFGHSTPGGSSSGSAISVAAGFTPLALGTETDGSTIGPAHRAGLYALKPHPGTVPMDGTYGLTVWDSIGTLAKSPADLTDLLNVVMQPSPNYSISELSKTKWAQLRVGFVDPSLWRLPESICPFVPEAQEEIETAFHHLRAQTERLGAKVRYPVILPATSSLSYEGQGVIGILINHEMKSRVQNFTSLLHDSSVRTLEDVVKFNEMNREREMPPGKPDQSVLIAALEYNRSDGFVNSAIAAGREAARLAGVDKALAENDVDVIVAPGDSAVTGLATCAGYPIAAVPLGTLSVFGRPHGVSILAKAGMEIKLLEFMYAYESSFPKRPLPERLSGQSSSL